MGMLSDMNSNENSPFDMMNDFPQLNGRPSSAGGPQGQGSMRKLGAAVSSVFQQNQEFSIQMKIFQRCLDLKVEMLIMVWICIRKNKFTIVRDQ
ncbi:hypothetical protein MKW92_009962 [Papaver armeniacum]|nr:hypothetical protein MKW92_009962 [Papaver armeniacum]